MVQGCFQPQGGVSRWLHQSVMEPRIGLARPTPVSNACSALHTGMKDGDLGLGEGWDAHCLVPVSTLVLITRPHLICLFMLFPLPLHRMTFNDFKVHFKLLVICRLTPGLLSQEVGQKWSYTTQEGRWEKGTTAGGPRKSPHGELVHRSQGFWV